MVTHDLAEAQTLADRLAVIDRGRLVGQGTTAEVLSDPAAMRVLGLREIAALLSARVEAHDDDGLTRLATVSGPIWVPRIDDMPGARIRVRIPAHDVILSRGRPTGLSAQNILPVRVKRLVPGEGPGVVVHLAVGDEEMLARITRRSALAMSLASGDDIFAILKSMSVARDNVAPAPADGP
jgi:molybdate transport system ATP-binding protein